MDQPTRRALLGSTAALIGLSAGCQQFLGDGGDPSAQYGTPEQSTELLSAGQAIVGQTPAGRPLISNGPQTVYVDPRGGDDSGAGTESDPLATIQEAVRRAPIYLRHQYTVDLATVPETPVRYDEDVLVPAVIGTGQASQEDGAPEAGPFNNLVIHGASGSSDAVEVGSVMFGNVIGTSASLLRHVTVTRNTPYDDEEHGVAAYGMGEVRLFDIRFTSGPTNGIIAYGANMKASAIDLGEENLTNGIRGKRHASVIVRDASGSLTGTAFRSVSNSQLTLREGNQVSGNPTFETRVGGKIYDLASDSWRGLNTESRTNASYQSNGDTDPDCGDIWYEDGTGEDEEGFYGQTADGSVKLG